MTWLSSWPQRDGTTTHRAHDTEAAAEAHSQHIVASGTAYRAVAYELVLPDEETTR